MPTCLSEITFGSLLVYSPRGSSATSIKSRSLTYQIKNNREGTITRLAERVAKEIATSEAARPLANLLAKEVILVPCPRSSLLVKGGLWPGEEIAKALVRAGLGKEVKPWLQRKNAVAKSSAAQPGERPTVEDHLKSMRSEADSTLFAPRKITIVDDVVTKGATLLAAASLLKEQFPSSEVQVFALVRTLGLQPEIDRILSPCVGTITHVRGDAQREP